MQRGDAARGSTSAHRTHPMLPAAFRTCDDVRCLPRQMSKRWQCAGVVTGAPRHQPGSAHAIATTGGMHRASFNAA